MKEKIASKWTPQEIKNAISVLSNIERDIQARILPQEVFEAHAKTFKKMATEIGVFDKNGRILLMKRPDKDTEPAEPFPSMWHVPGVTHNRLETVEDTQNRLILDELHGVVSLDSTKYVGLIEGVMPHRGLIHALIFSAYTDADAPVGGRFFSIDELPNNIIEFHRDITIPFLLEARTNQ